MTGHVELRHFKKAIDSENVLLKVGRSEGLGVVEGEDGGQVRLRSPMNKRTPWLMRKDIACR